MGQGDFIYERDLSKKMSKKIYTLTIYQRIFKENHFTQFGENMIERAPKYEVITQCVFRKYSMDQMFSVFLKASKEAPNTEFFLVRIFPYSD